MHYSKPVDTLVEKVLTLSHDQCPQTDKRKERMSDVPYASATGSLMYDVLCTTVRHLLCVWFGKLLRM